MSDTEDDDRYILEFHDDGSVCDCYDYCDVCGMHYLDCECGPND